MPSQKEVVQPKDLQRGKAKLVARGALNPPSGTTPAHPGRETRPSRLVSLAVPATNHMYTLYINHIIFFH
jgi:hypothetical protein